ncbi:MAG TPA: flavodoxin domain-containing protein [Casimicrobiaceae bacterium]|jgi:MioC protein
MLNITVLVGTMTGTAQLVAQEIELAYAGPETHIDVTFMDGLDRRVFDRSGVFLICTSTYGQGDVPDNAKAFYADLVTCRDDLTHVRYGVFALGDSTHVGTFCFGGRRFDAALAARGAQRIGDVLEHNASGGTLPEEVALEWFPEWLRLARAAMGPAAPAGTMSVAQSGHPCD